MSFLNSRAMIGDGASAVPHWQERPRSSAALSAPDETRLTDRIGAILTRREVSAPFSQSSEPLQPADARAFAREDDIHITPRFEQADVTQPPAKSRRLVLFGAALAACAAIALCWAVLPVDGAPAQVRIALSLDEVRDPAERLSLLRNEARAVTAPDNLSRVVERARLDRDPEFSGEASGGLAILADMVTGSSASDPGQTARNRLRAAVATQVDPRDNAILLTVRAADAAKSEAIAQEIAASYAEASQPVPVRRVDSLETAAAPRTDSGTAQAKLDAFIAAGGEKVVEAARLRKEVDRLRLENAEAQKNLLKESARTASGSLTSLMDGSFPPELITPTLEDLRSRYATARLEAQQLSQALGPRHPRLQSAQAIADGLKSDIEREIRGVFADARASLQQAQDKARLLASQSAEALRKLRETGVDVDRLEQLQAAAQDAHAPATDGITTASIPAAASRPFTPMVERVEKSVPPAVETSGSPSGMMAVLAVALATGAGFFGMTRLMRRRLGEEISLMAGGNNPPVMPVRNPREEWSAVSPDHDSGPEADIARLRRDVAALKQRVREYAVRQYPYGG